MEHKAPYIFRKWKAYVQQVSNCWHTWRASTCFEAFDIQNRMGAERSKADRVGMQHLKERSLPVAPIYIPTVLFAFKFELV